MHGSFACSASSYSSGFCQFSYFPDPSYFYMEVGSGIDFESGTSDYYEYDYITSFDQAKPDADCNFSVTLNSTERRISYFIEKQEGIKYNIRRCIWIIKPREVGHNITLDVELSPYNTGIIAYSFMAGNNDDMIRIDIAPRNILSKYCYLMRMDTFYLSV